MSFWQNMAPALLDFLISSRRNSQLMKYSVPNASLAVNSLARKHTVFPQTRMTNSLFAGWLVASPVNPWKLCSCELCYSWRDVGAESSEIFLSVKKKPTSSILRDAFLSERLWGSTIQIIWSLFSCGSVDVMPSSVPETSCKLSLHCLERKGRIFLYGQPVVWHFKHPFSKVWKIESSHRNNFPGESEL